MMKAKQWIQDEPWLLMGYFNIIRYDYEKIGSLERGKPAM